jgi:WD40 repeat protein
VLTTSFMDPMITVWDAVGGVKLRQFRGYAASNGAALSLDGNLAVTADMSASARLWDVRTGTLLTALIGADNAWSAVFAKTPTRLATTSGGGKIFVWDCEPCGALPDLVRLARERLKDALTEEQLRAVALQ